MSQEPDPVRLIKGGIHRDVRGEVRFINYFDFSRIDRLYTIQPSKAGVVRGWVGHWRDWKWFSVLKGAMKIGVVIPAIWDSPSGQERVVEYILGEEPYMILEVPPGRFTASLALSSDAIMLVF